MPRNITSTWRRSTEAQLADEVDLCFLTITHPTLIDPVRIVWDTKYFIKGGFTFIGFPFEISILSDDEQPPQAQLSIQNVDPRIGDSIQVLTSPPRLKIELCSSSDFDLTVDPRTEIGTANIAYMADKLFLTNVSVDIMVITGTIVGWDYLQRVWPGPRAMEDTFPGLFR